VPTFPLTFGKDKITSWFSISTAPSDRGGEYWNIPFPKNTSLIHSNHYLEDLTEKMVHMLGHTPSGFAPVSPPGVLRPNNTMKEKEAEDFLQELQTHGGGASRLNVGSVYQSPDLTDLVFYKSNKRTINVQARLTCATVEQSVFCKKLANFLQLASLPRNFVTPPKLFKIHASTGSTPSTTHNDAFFPYMTPCVLEELGISTLGHPNMHTSHVAVKFPLQYHIRMVFREKSPVYNVLGKGLIQTRHGTSWPKKSSGT